MGFFYSESKVVDKRPGTRSRSGGTRAPKIEQLRSIAVRGCSVCPLDKAPGLEHPKMLPTGSDQPLAYILGEAPGKTEDEKGEQFVGDAGELLRPLIPTRFKSLLRWNNTLRCRPPKNRDPEPLETECCRRLQVEDIQRTRPKVILGFGDVPLRWITGENGLKIGVWRGRRLAVRVGTHECWYYPIWHPAFILRLKGSAREKEYTRVFERDILQALKSAEDPKLPAPYVEEPNQYYENMETLETPDLQKLTSWIEEMCQWPEAGFDIETNSLRPYFKARRILTLAVSNYDRTFCIPYQHPGLDWGAKLPQVKKLIEKFLLSRCRKWCHNEKFELEWLAEEFGERVLWDGLWGDTFAQAYVLDERKGGKGLDDLTLIHFGFNVKRLNKLRVDRLAQEPLHDVLIYNGCDAKYTYPLHLLLGEQIKKQGLESVYTEQHRRAVPIVLGQRRGLLPDTKAAKKLADQYQGLVTKAEQAVLKNKDVIRFQQAGHEFSATSNTNLLSFFRDFLKYHSVCNTGDEKHPRWSVDEDVLSKIPHPAARSVLELRKASKLLSTYLLPLCPGGDKLHEDGLIHTNYNHCLTSTRRLSSDDPNMQNFPKRKDKHIRVVVRAPDGHWLASFDYGQIEFRVIGWASRDKTLVKACWEKYDVHGEWAKRIAAAQPHLRQIMIDDFNAPSDDEKIIMKKLRDEVKNRWVFPLFFGSQQSSVEEDLWCQPGDLKKEFDEFWKMFSGVKKWQEKLISDYRKNGYVETLTGFRRHAPLKYNEALNEPVQGTASDIVVDGMCRLSEAAHELNCDPLQFRMNVHDDLGFYLPDGDLEETIEVIAREMCRASFDFICTPVIVETAVGPNWYEQEVAGVFDSSKYGFHERPKWLD